MEIIIRKLGNSVGFTLPPPLLRELGLSVGQSVIVRPNEDGSVLLQPKRAVKKYTAAELNALCDLTAPMPADLLAWDAMPAVGSEVL